MASETDEKNVLKTVWRWLSGGLNVYGFLAHLSGAAWATWGMQQVTNNGLALVGIFSVSWLVVRAVFGVVKYAYRRANPPVAALTAHSGKKASIGLRHLGAATVYRAEARITKALDGSPLTYTNRFQCQVHPKGEDARNDWFARLRHEDWANIIVGSVETSANDEYYLAARVGRYGQNVTVPDDGVEIELQIRMTPPRRLGPVVKKLHLKRDNGIAVVSILPDP